MKIVNSSTLRKHPPPVFWNYMVHSSIFINFLKLYENCFIMTLFLVRRCNKTFAFIWLIFRNSFSNILIYIYYNITAEGNSFFTGL